MKTFRWKSTGVVEELPDDYGQHPIFGDNLEEYTPGDEWEEDKVVSEDHTIPVDQRGTVIATPASDASDKTNTNTEGNE